MEYLMMRKVCHSKRYFNDRSKNEIYLFQEMELSPQVLWITGYWMPWQNIGHSCIASQF